MSDSDFDLIGIDTETGGVYPAIHPLLSVALVPSWGVPPTTIYVLPEPGKVIEAKAAEINGYTPELWAERGAVPLRQGLLMLGAQLQVLLADRPGARLVAHNAGFDRMFLEEAMRPFEMELPGRHRWECSMHELGSLITDGLIPEGGRGLDRLGALAGLWPMGGRPKVHDVTEDAVAALKGFLWLKAQRKAGRVWREDAQVLQQTNALARTLAGLDGYAFSPGYPFHEHSRLAETTALPQQAKYWEMARQAQVLLTDTDPDDALV